MNGRDAPDLLTRLQDALNIIHDQASPSRPSCVLHNARPFRRGPFQRPTRPQGAAGRSQRASMPRAAQRVYGINVTRLFPDKGAWRPREVPRGSGIATETWRVDTELITSALQRLPR